MYVHHTLIFAWAMNVLGGTLGGTLPRMLYVEVHILAAYNNNERLSYRIAGNFAWCKISWFSWMVWLLRK